MRFRSLGAALAAAALLCAPQAHADNYNAKDASGTTITLAAKLIGGVLHPIHLLYGMFGSTPTPVTTDASGNLNVNVAGGTLPAFGSTPTFNLGTISTAATAANQATMISSLGTISTNSALQATAAKQDTGNTSLASIVTNTTGLATASAQTTGNSSLASIATNTANAGAPSVASDSTGNVKVIQANASAPISISTATTTQLVALTSSKKIYVTYLNYVASGTATVTLVTGTGTNCGTGQTSLGGAQDLTAQAGVSGGSGLGPILVVPAGQALCITNSAAQKVAGWLAYTVQP